MVTFPFIRIRHFDNCITGTQESGNISSLSTEMKYAKNKYDFNEQLSEMAKKECTFC